MTDIEFIQVLRAAAKVYSNMATDAADRIERLCDEINRQNAENERKDRILESYALQYGTVTDKEVFLKQARAEAIKEFADRLKERKYQSSGWLRGEHPYVVEESDIDEILEEMTEEQT